MIVSSVPETLLGLVQRYSPSGQEQEAVSYLIERMQTTGYGQAYKDEIGNAVGVMGNGTHQVILLGHIDTVPGEITLRTEGDSFYGRGTVDAKGPLAAFVDSVAAVGAIPGWQFVVIGAIDEERDSTGARYIVDQYHPDIAIIGEPSRWNRITLGYKGSAWAEITVRKPIAHTAGHGKSVCEVAVDVWEAIRTWANEFNSGRDQIFKQVSVTLRKMVSWGDSFEEWAKLQLSTRLPLDLSPDAYYVILHDLASPAEVKQIGYPIPAYRSDKNNPLVRAFLTGIRAIGGKPRFVLKSGTADMNIIGPKWNCPVVAYGPGDSNLDHSPEEHILLSEYGQSVEVLKEVMLKLSRG